MTGRDMVRAVLAQARIELTLTLRRGESVLVTLIIPLALLVFFSTARILPGPGRKIEYLLAGTVALSVISTALVSLGIATAYERYYGVLKQLGATPLSRGALVAGKMLAVAALEALQVALLAGTAVLFGWRFSLSPGPAVAALILGTACFAGLGLALAGGLRAEATLGVANGLFLFFLLLGGLYLPLGDLPPWLAAVARALPAAPLVEILRAAIGGGGTGTWVAWAVLIAWSVGAPVVAAAVFRWE